MRKKITKTWSIFDSLLLEYTKVPSETSKPNYLSSLEASNVNYGYTFLFSINNGKSNSASYGEFFSPGRHSRKATPPPFCWWENLESKILQGKDPARDLPHQGGNSQGGGSWVVCRGTQLALTGPNFLFWRNKGNLREERMKGGIEEWGTFYFIYHHLFKVPKEPPLD